MNKGLSKSTVFMDENRMVNVFDLSTKEIVFCGNIGDVANFLGVNTSFADQYVKNKWRFKKKYALRIKTTK